MTVPVRISVIVPVYEHWHLVPALLDCLAAQTMPQDQFEIVLVDSGSSSIIVPSNMPANARILRCEKPGSYAARNMGVRDAVGSILAFTDADCLPATRWLELLAAEFIERGGELVAGDIEMVAATDDPNAWEIYDLLRGLPQRRFVSKGYAATANLAVTRHLYDRNGGFDEARMSGGDVDFCCRAAAKGATLRLVGAAIVRHPARASFAELSTKARRIKGGQFRRANGAVGRLRVAAATLVHPALDVWRFARASKWPLRYRLAAIGVRFQLWIVELVELARLATGAGEERR